MNENTLVKMLKEYELGKSTVVELCAKYEIHKSRFYFYKNKARHKIWRRKFKGINWDKVRNQL